jgi:polar amino acid transport system permease protein
MTLDWTIVWDNLDLFLHGAVMSVALTLAAMAMGLPLGLAMAGARMSSVRSVSWTAGAVGDVLRTTPVLLQIYWVFYVVPVMLDMQVGAVTTALLTLGLNVAAYNAEIFRAGIMSIRPGQANAARALGMSRWQVYRRVILPQAIRRVVPSLANIWVSLFKNTSLVSTIAVSELTYVALKIRVDSYRVLEVLTAVAVIYWLLGYPQAKAVDWLHQKFKVDE